MEGERVRFPYVARRNSSMVECNFRNVEIRVRFPFVAHFNLDIHTEIVYMSTIDTNSNYKNLTITQK